MMPCAFQRVRLEEPFRLDAKAQGELVVVGGWEPKRGPQGKLDTQASRWFSIRLTPESAPWAFRKGLPFKSIMALAWAHQGAPRPRRPLSSAASPTTRA